MRRSSVVAAALLGALAPICTCVAIHASAQTSKSSTILVLRDPTPRPVDLDKVYSASNVPGQPPAERQLTAYNQKRFALITHASSQLTSLADKLHQGIATHPQGASLDSEIQIASAIEMLAGDVHASLAGKQDSQTKAKARQEKARPFRPADFQPDTKRLLSATLELEKEVGKSTPDTLSVRTMNTSEQIAKLAREIKGRLACVTPENATEASR